MLLIEWMQANKLTCAEVSRQLGCTYSTLYRHLHAQSRLSPEVCLKVVEVSKGRVSRELAMWPEILEPEWEQKYKKSLGKRKKRTRKGEQK